MLSSIFHQNLDTFDIFALVSAILFVVAMFLVHPTPNPPRSAAWASAIGFLAAAVFAFGFLFFTP